MGGGQLPYSYYFQKRYFCVHFTECCLVFLNITSVNLAGAELFIYFNYILTIFYSIFGWQENDFTLLVHSKNKQHFICKICLLLSGRLYIKPPNYDMPKIAIPLSQSSWNISWKKETDSSLSNSSLYEELVSPHIIRRHVSCKHFYLSCY